MGLRMGVSVWRSVVSSSSGVMATKTQLSLMHANVDSREMWACVLVDEQSNVLLCKTDMYLS